MQSNQQLQLQQHHQQPQQQRMRRDEPHSVFLPGSKTDFAAIGESLWALRDTILKQRPNEGEWKNIEIEVRLGMITSGVRRWRSLISQSFKDNLTGAFIIDASNKHKYGVDFDAGIDRTHSQRLDRIFANFDKSEVTEQLVRITDDKIRYEVKAGQDDKPLEQKEAPICRSDIAMYAFHYDIRINCCVETPIEAEYSNSGKNHSSASSKNWKMERLKRRISYTSKTHNPWRIDVTEVVPRTRDLLTGEITTENRLYEVELELLPDTMQKWLSCPKDSAVQMTNDITQELYNLLKTCVPYEFEHEDGLETPLDQNYYGNVIRELTLRILNLDSRTPQVFVGSMPFSMSRRNLEVVCKNSYYVTEKTDGVRFLLYVVQGPNRKKVAVLYERSKKVKMMKGAELIAEKLGENTVLDGELVYDSYRRKTIFLIFDVLAIDGKTLCGLLFQDRLKALERDVKQRCEEINKNGGNSIIQLVLKKFIPKLQLKKLLDAIKIEGVSKIFREIADDGRVRQEHKTDGLIFQPNTPYKPFLYNELVKWKYADLCSVDMLVEVREEEDPTTRSRSTRPRLYCSASYDSMQDRVYIDCSKRGKEYVGLEKFGTYRLLADYEDHLRAGSGHSNRCIAEVSYDVNVGTWVYSHLRKDKMEPNFIDVVMGVLVEQAEEISIEELEYTILAETDAENDFQVQLRRMKAKCLEWQRNGRR